MMAIRYIVFVLAASLFLLSCKKDFIDIKSKSQVSSADFFKTPEDIEQGVIGAYDALQSYGQYGQNFVYFMEVHSDNATLESTTAKGGIYGDFEDFQLQPANVILNETWKACYAGVQRCNIVLNRIDAIAMEDSRKATRVAELKFLRALTYYNMVQIWGDIPLVLTETEDPFSAFEHSRNSTAEIYSYLEKDLKEAITALPQVHPAAEAGRATKGAAQTLLAKVYLLQKKYGEAYSILQQVISSGTYSLASNYADLFGAGAMGSGEIIFQIQFLKGGVGEGSAYVNLFAPLGDKTLTGGIGNTFGENIPTSRLVASFAPGDKRRAASIDSIAKGRYYNRKFLDKPYQDMDAGSNFNVLRYADVLLMCAEAENEMGGSETALGYLNAVRRRAGVPEYTPATINSQQLCRNAIENERQWELCFENHRWFDLKRTGRAIDVMAANGYRLSDHQLLFPIPQSQIDITGGKIRQNTGY